MEKISLKELEKEIDSLLDSETPESLLAFLSENKTNMSSKKVIEKVIETPKNSI